MIDFFTNREMLQVFLRMASKDGREPVLFGDCLPRAERLLPDYMAGESFPQTYLEFPLLGEPFLDVGVIYGPKLRNARIEAPSARGTESALDWFQETAVHCPDISFGYELDLKGGEPDRASVHFQPRTHVELAVAFCRMMGEPEMAERYLELAQRLPAGWHPSRFGIFRGRPNAPLRVCGYLSRQELDDCVSHPERLETVFEKAGFRAYDSGMMGQIISLMSAAPLIAEYEFDVFPDGTLGQSFALSVSLPAGKPEEIRTAFQAGKSAEVIALITGWGIADTRWKTALDMCFAGALPGKGAAVACILHPHWLKVRWTNKTPQPAKLYMIAQCAVL